jgi:cobalamin biosynthesis Mg chelatase CobN
MQSLVRGIGGEFVLPAPGGDVVRDGAGVLPTGRNIHALDPYRIPSAAAMVRGRTAATLILEAHRKKGRSHLHYALFIISSLHILLPILFLSCSCQAHSHVT